MEQHKHPWTGQWVILHPDTPPANITKTDLVRATFEPFYVEGNSNEDRNKVRGHFWDSTQTIHIGKERLHRAAKADERNFRKVLNNTPEK